MDIIILLLLVFGVIFVTISWARSELRCPPPKVIYRYVPKHTLDVQFGEENNPSEIYRDMFNQSSPWIGGFKIGNKTFVSDQNTVEPKSEPAAVNAKTKKMDKSMNVQDVNKGLIKSPSNLN